MKPTYQHQYPIELNSKVQMTLRISQQRLCELIRSGLVSISDFKCDSAAAKAILHHTALECTALDLAQLQRHCSATETSKPRLTR